LKFKTAICSLRCRSNYKSTKVLYEHMTYVGTIYKFPYPQVSREMLSDNYIDQRKVAFEIKLSLSNKMHVWIFVTKLIVFFLYRVHTLLMG